MLSSKSSAVWVRLIGLVLLDRTPCLPWIQPAFRSPSQAEIARIFSNGPQPLHPSLVSLILLLLEYIRQTEWSSEASKTQAEEEWKLFDAVYMEANKVWQGSPDSGWLGRGMRKMAENLLHLAFRVSL